MKNGTEQIIYNYIGKKIRFERRIKNITQKELAKVINCYPSRMSEIETAVRRISIYNLYLIAEYLNVDILEFLPRLKS